MPTTNPTLLFLGTKEDIPYLPMLKSCFGAASVFIVTEPIHTIFEVIAYCKNPKRNITGVVSTNKTLLTKLLGTEHERKQPSLNDYAGSYFLRDGIEFVFINPVEQFQTVPYGAFVGRRFISKLASPELWNKSTEFNWEIADASNLERLFTQFQTAFAISVDIETFSNPPSIRCIGYTGIFIDDITGNIRTHSFVLPVDSEFNLSWMRKLNWELKAPKIFQNGKYDISYLSMYNAVPYLYLWDTAHLFHSWYSELPKDLGFLNAFFVREAMYWKDLSETNDLHEYYRYNALDGWATANVWIAQMLELPEWARKNYTVEFPLVFPCHLAEMTGVKRDMERLAEARKVVKGRINEKQKRLEIVTATPRINPNSPKQIGQLVKILGCADITSTNEKDLKKVSLRHPINSKIINLILDIRGDRKLVSTYLRADEDKEKESDKGNKEFYGRILYALNPHGTDTGRLASREHHFWCGLQIQNIPRGEPGETSWTKYTICADDGFRFGEVDLEQAESRDTGYAAGDEKLIGAVTGIRDFHSVNASAFFGVPYEDIYDDSKKKTKNKKIRDLSKRTNHGANYLMGARVLLDTMGEEFVLEAKIFLKLPKAWSLLQVCEYLLEQFHKTYPGLSSTYYPAVVQEAVTTRMLVSHAHHHTVFREEDNKYIIHPTIESDLKGWTRYCFGKPEKNKLDKNSLVAHVSQSLNAMTLNKAWLRVFYDIAMNPAHSKNFKLCAQIHDSILFQFREGHEYLCEMVKARMEIPVTIKSYDGKIRTFTVPAAIKAGKDGLGSKYWSDTE